VCADHIGGTLWVRIGKDEIVAEGSAMYPDPTGNTFGGSTPPRPAPRVIGTAGLPAQRNPWEPPPRPQPDSPPRPQPEQPPRHRVEQSAPFRFGGPAESGPVESGPVESGPVDRSLARPVPAEADRVPPAQVEPDREPPPTEPVDATQTELAPEAAAEVDTEDADTEDADRETAASGRETAAVAADTVEADPGSGAAAAAEPGEATGQQAAEPAASLPRPARRLRPGDVPETRVALWGSAGAEADDFRDRIREAGNLFIDDPHFAVTATAAVVTDAVNALGRALERQQAELDPRHGSDSPDTESLRIAVRRYRELLDRVLAL
jgi:hypothetical protein